MTQLQLPVTYRPHPVGVLFWLLVATPASLGMFAVFRWVLEAPLFAQMFIAFLVLAIAVSAIAIAFSYFKVSEEGIESRYFRHAKGKWTEVEAWTRWGDDGTLYIRFKNGRIIGSDGWALGGDDVDQVVELLETRVGEQSKGENGVLPRLVDAFLGGLMRGR
jgi:hypothetical protein